MLSRRRLVGIIGFAATLRASSFAVAQSTNDTGTVDESSDEIQKWMADPANSAYFQIDGVQNKGSKILSPSDERVREAARFLSAVPKTLTPIETARYIYDHLPAGKRMEWPRDRPHDPQPANPIIVAFFAATDTEPFDGDQTAWCAAFACWTLKRAGHKSPHNAGSKAFRSWGTTTKDPQVGDLAVFQNKSHPLNGHVTYFDGWVSGEQKQFWCLGGNQRDTLGRSKFSRDMKSLKLLHFATNI